MKKMTVSEVREAYQLFFEQRDHVRIPSAPLVPENDPTTLFIGSGMQPLIPYLLGQPHEKGVRLVNSQLCFRAEDIEEIGDNRHTTFFEMLGNWSLGDYYREEQLSWIFTFLTEQLEIDPERLYVTVFAGDERSEIPRDEESAALWKQLFLEKGMNVETKVMFNEQIAAAEGMGQARIFYYDAKKNWWSRAGLPEEMPGGEPGGPDSELFYEFTQVQHDTAFGEHCHPNCDCGRFVEIGNSVFMEYVKRADGKFDRLPRPNIDFGGGLERLTAAANNQNDVFLLSDLKDLVATIDQMEGRTVTYEATDSTEKRAYRIVVDAIRGATFMMGAGIEPAKSDQGYIVRRLLRRAVRNLDLLGLEVHSLEKLVPVVIKSYAVVYPMLRDKTEMIVELVAREEDSFRQALARGLRELDKLSKGETVTGEIAFQLYSTHGFPVELVHDVAQEKGLTVDLESFEAEMTKHRQASRAGAAEKFKGGLKDHSEMSVKYHTATHLLHQALRAVLGEEVFQKGSNITPERLRFDFAYPAKLTDEQKERVVSLVNEMIAADLEVLPEEMSVEEAKERGALGLFEDKYDEVVRVYSIGDFSIEICGGPHVTRTAELGLFRIVKEESASAGVRRIKAVLE